MKMYIYKLILLFLICLRFYSVAHLPVKVVHEFPNILYGGSDSKSEKVNIAMHPANFSGPEHLKPLQNTCFNYKDKKYMYTLCPFKNVTQEEINVSEPYKGTVGIWGQWLISDNHFDGFHFIEGDTCGSHGHREINVYIHCNKTKTYLFNVTEPRRCFYESHFYSPLFCGLNSLVVYPRLPSFLQNYWDELETLRRNKDINSKRYFSEIKNVFTDAGFYLSDDTRQKLLHSKNLAVPEPSHHDEPSLTCEEELNLLKARVKELENLLQ